MPLKQFVKKGMFESILNQMTETKKIRGIEKLRKLEENVINQNYYIDRSQRQDSS
jgi:hypothetical protein